MSKQPSPKFKDYTNTFFSQAEPLSAEKRNELILTYTPLIKYIAARLAARLPAQVSLDDLISCGIIGLIDAINKFDVSKNVQFKTYAEFRVKGAMLDELRALDWVPRSVRRKTTDLEKAYADIEKQMGRPATDEEVAKTMGLALDDFYKLLDETKSVSFMDIEFLRQKSMETSDPTLAETFAMDDRDPFTSLNLTQIRELLTSAIDDLPEKEKLTVSLYYQEELTMKEIGEVLGYTESRISQMHSKAMFRLRAKLKKSLAS
ncbi:MAG: FliA/WhiG family RNA polymerase sigma factor [Desulfurivibrionaceae bacterium]|jgi:RNA polymerase sigma factor for flagellar operon FliA|nr:FliA/WhiG family RNA polymerase sigma factor [Pseudomonadota bacterium]MCG2824557.1 FliA/WhiG family RNA polymerase sigma factor [Desulfobulbaceae bacterium]MDP2003111.1 FliA/WhiG family RNA polymerase sigma factor [Desulfurivibrionaceae bacterium]PKN16741.1 MAG: FliA/WhiG family RNA polymerase sigma factor [Deltaproteobacteria bacterium HGW-Deltaproteobacteria-3]MBU4228772.1 FliA/WhiG family RNA polymerase sigma factor [Pseudomonadota bacterium]